MGVIRSSKAFKRMQLRMASNSLTNGRPTSMLQTPMRHTTNTAASALNQLGYMEEPKSGVSTDQIAYETMNAIGYTVEVGNADYSLVNSQTDDELVENPNISNEQQLASLENEAVEMIDQFPNECDPIYQADDPRPDNMRDIGGFRDMDEVNAIDLVASGHALGNAGLVHTPKNETTKYFNNQSMDSALKGLNR